MFKEQAGALRVHLKPSWNELPIDVCPSNADTYHSAGSSIVFANPYGFKDVEVCLRQHWMDEEAAAQNTTYVGERLTKPQERIVTLVRNIGDAVGQVLDLERRGREYSIERQILKQPRNVQIGHQKGANRNDDEVDGRGHGSNGTGVDDKDAD